MGREGGEERSWMRRVVWRWVIDGAWEWLREIVSLLLMAVGRLGKVEVEEVRFPFKNAYT